MTAPAKAYLVKDEKVNFTLRQSPLFGRCVLEEEVKVKLRPEMITPFGGGGGTATLLGGNPPSATTAGVSETNLCIILKDLLFSNVLPPPSSNLEVQEGPSSAASASANDKELRILFDAPKRCDGYPVLILNITIKGTPLQDLTFLFGPDKKDLTLKMILSNIDKLDDLLPPGKRARMDNDNSQDNPEQITELATSEMPPLLEFDNAGSVIFTSSIVKPCGGRLGPPQQGSGSVGGTGGELVTHWQRGPGGVGWRRMGVPLQGSGGAGGRPGSSQQASVGEAGGDDNVDSASSTVASPLEFSADLSIILTTKQEYCSDLFRLNKRMLSEQFRADMAIVARNGAGIPCHKVFLSARNEGLKRIIDNGLGPTNRLILNDVSEATLRALLSYLYYMDLDKPKEDCELAMELLEVGQRYQVTFLDKVMTQILLEQPTPNFPLFVAFRLFFIANGNPELDKLKKKCIEVLRLKRNELNAFQDFNSLFTTAPDNARELCVALIDI